MLKLNSKNIRCMKECTLKDTLIVRLSSNINLPEVLREKEFLILDSQCKSVPYGFVGYFVTEDQSLSINIPNDLNNVFLLPNDQYYLADGDVVRFNPIRLELKTIYRKTSKHNSVLVTERCNNYCLMCSQPPKDIDDSYIVNDLLKAIPLMSKETNELGITGGEPTLLGDDLIKILRACKNYLPDSSLHMLSNGRNFSDINFTNKVAEVNHPDFMIGIPLYSDVGSIHDYVVQADGAFDETIRGILNLKARRQLVEIRVVIHKQTYQRLPQLAEFITRNLLFVDHVALMGLEMMGFTKANINDLWINPIEYQSQLVEAVETLARFKMNVSLYNHQLCLLDKRLWSFNRKSISDWKNEYMPECEPCTKKDECGGFFSSAKFKYSESIKAYV